MAKIHEQKETTAPISSVGADEGQPSTTNTNIIPQNPENSAEESKFSSEGQQGCLSLLPEEIKRDGLFCAWRRENRNGSLTKVPYNPCTGLRAKSNDPQSFTSFDQAMKFHGYDGLGIGIFGSICAIDLDDCITDSGCYTPEAADIIAIMRSYTEISPGGNGVHILFSANGFQYDTERYKIMNRDQHIEVYVAGATQKYVTVTGKAAADYDYGDRTDELKIVLEKYMLRNHTGHVVNVVNVVNAENAVNATDSEALTDEKLIQLAMNSGKGEVFRKLWNGDLAGHQSQSEADLALCSQLAFWTGKDAGRMDELFRESGLMRPKWDERHGKDTYGVLTIQKAIAGCSSVYQPKKAQNEPEQSFQPLKPLNEQFSTLPAFPVDCLPSIMRDYAMAVSANTQTSVDMAAVIGIGVLSACLQRKYVVEAMPGYIEPLNLYVLPIAAPGERKSSVMAKMTRALYDYEYDYNQEHEAEVRRNKHERESLERQIAGLQEKLKHTTSSREELELQHLQDTLADLPEAKPARFIADDCSSEALTKLLADNDGVISVISTEGGIFDIMSGRYNKQVNIDVWLKGHCGDPIRVDRLGRDAEYVPNPSLTAILSVQPSVLEEIMTNTVMNGRGLIARFLYAYPPSKVGSRVFCAPMIPVSVENEYRMMVYRLMNVPKLETPIHLTLTDAAVRIMNEYFSQHERFLTGDGQPISEWASKYIGTVLRIAGLLHAAETDMTDTAISADTIQRAIRIGTYFLAHASYAYSLLGCDVNMKKARFVLNKILKERITAVKRWELFSKCRCKYFKDKDDILPTLELLEANGYIRIDENIGKPGAGRKPDAVVVVNPLIHEKQNGSA